MLFAATLAAQKRKAKVCLLSGLNQLGCLPVVRVKGIF